MSSVTVNQLPETEQVVSGNYFIVQTENATERLDYKNLILGLENVTFASTISSNSTNIATLSSQLATLSGTIVNAILPVGALTITVNNTNPSTYIYGTTWTAVTALSTNAQVFTWQRFS
jgi:hypothetical protein